MVPFVAIWDTGATGSVITQAIIDSCSLVPTGMALMHHAQGSSQVETYLVNIGLPNGVLVYGVRVTKGELPGGGDMLIGMNIISKGDFAVTNFNGITKFSFRFPSVAHIDFAEDIKKPQHGGKPRKANQRNRFGGTIKKGKR